MSYPLLERGFLSIGYSDFATAGFISSVNAQGDNKQRFFAEQVVKEWREFKITAWSLWHFLFEMKKGDRVVVPGFGVYSVYDILEDSGIAVCDPSVRQDIDALVTTGGQKLKFAESGYLIRESGPDIDFGFLRRVKPVYANIPRYDYCDAKLSSRLKYRRTTLNISDLSTNLDRCLEHFQKKRPIRLYSVVSAELVEKLFQAIRANLRDDKCELLIKWYFEHLGATEVIIPARNQPAKKGDADIIATFESLKTIYYIQAKFHERETSDWGLEQITQYVDEAKMLSKGRRAIEKHAIEDDYAKNAWLVSNCDSFDERCIEKAKEADIMLISGREFARMLINAGLSGLDKAL